MKAALAQGFTLVLFREFLFFEFQDVAHRLIVPGGERQVDINAEMIDLPC